MVWGVKNGDLNAVTGLVESDVSNLSISWCLLSYIAVSRFIFDCVVYQVQASCLLVYLYRNRTVIIYKPRCPTVDCN